MTGRPRGAGPLPGTLKKVINEGLKDMSEKEEESQNSDTEPEEQEETKKIKKKEETKNKRKTVHFLN